MVKSGPPSPYVNLPFVRWIKISGQLGEHLGYKGPAAYMPAVMTDRAPEGYFSSLDLLRGLVLCWRQSPPEGRRGLPEDARRQALERLAAACGGMSVKEAVHSASAFFLETRALQDEGMRAAINGLNICGEDPAYRAAFILMAAEYARSARPETVSDAARHILAAAKDLDLDGLPWLERETILGAQAAALVGLNDRAGLAEFNRERIERYKFHSQALADAVADLVVNPGIYVAYAFYKLYVALLKVFSEELNPDAQKPRRRAKKRDSKDKE